MSQGHDMSGEEPASAGHAGLQESSAPSSGNPDPAVQAALSERVGDEAAELASPGDEASSREVAQLRRDVAQLTETVALLLDMQQGGVSLAGGSAPRSEQGRSSLLGAAGAAAETARVQGQDALQRGQEAVGALGSTLERQVTTLTREVAGLAERNPLGTVLGALGLGFLVGAVLRRR